MKGKDYQSFTSCTNVAVSTKKWQTASLFIHFFIFAIYWAKNIYNFKQIRELVLDFGQLHTVIQRKLCELLLSILIIYILLDAETDSYLSKVPGINIHVP